MVNHGVHHQAAETARTFITLNFFSVWRSGRLDVQTSGHLNVRRKTSGALALQVK